MLWVDKYRPNDLNKLDFHAELTSRLSSMAADGELPHMLFYGPSGSGKKTRVMALLKAIYGPGAEKLKLEHRTFQKEGSSVKVEINTISSNYHIELNPSDAGKDDTFVIQEFIKEVASHSNIESSEKKKGFKVILLTEVEKLSRNAQAALRRTMEKYTSSCRLILLCRSPCQVIDPVRSRCLGIRVPSPSQLEIQNLLTKICTKESLKLPEPLAAKIALSSEGNVRRAIFMLEACKVSQYPFSNDQAVQIPDWELYIQKMALELRKEQTPDKLLEARGKVYNLLVNCIPGTTIIKMLSKELMRNLDDELKHEICTAAAFYEHRMHRGTKEIFHIEAFIAKFMSLLKRHEHKLMAAMVDDDDW